MEESTRTPMARVSVQIPGTMHGTVTDSLGHYELSGLNGRQFIVRARRIGYIYEMRESHMPFLPHTVCGTSCEPWKPVDVLNFYMRRETALAEF